MMRSPSFLLLTAAAALTTAACDGFFGFRERRLASPDASGVDATDPLPTSTDAPDADVEPDVGAEVDASASAPAHDGGGDASADASCDPTQIQWVGAKDGLAPDGAFLGSEMDNVRLYVCRNRVGADVVPGKLFQRIGGCFHGDGTNEVGFAGYEVLVPGQCLPRWEKVVGGVLPPSALETGRAQDQPLGSCRVRVNGDFHLGHVGASTGNRCRYSNGAKSFDESAFEVLTLP